MSANILKTILVIGDNPDAIVKKYSADTKVEKYLAYKRDDAASMQRKHIKLVEELLKNKSFNLSESQKDVYKSLYHNLKDMSDFEYFLYITKGCTYDESTGDAYSTDNPNAYYRSEKCYDKRLKKYGEEAPCCNPFKLKDGTLSYSARMGEIEWAKNHMYNTGIYESAWDLVVNDKEPVSEQERQIKEHMKNRIVYFSNFSSKEEYVRHSCSFWTYGIATEKKYEEVNYKIKDKDWVANFYDKYIAELDGGTLLTLYEAMALSI